MLIVQRKDAPNDGVAARVAAVEEALRELGAGAADGRCRGGAAFARAAALEHCASKMLGGASQTVSKIRVIRNGK